METGASISAVLPLHFPPLHTNKAVLSSIPEASKEPSCFNRNMMSVQGAGAVLMGWYIIPLYPRSNYKLAAGTDWGFVIDFI